MLVNLDAQQIIKAFSYIAQQGSIEEVSQALATLQRTETALITRLKREKLRVKAERQAQQHQPRVKAAEFTIKQRENKALDYDYWTKAAVNTKGQGENQVFDEWAMCYDR